MARTKATAPERIDARVDTAALDKASAALTTLNQRSMEIAQRFGDGEPYERSQVVGKARFYMAQSAEAMLELGKCLIQIKENEPHGDFTLIVTERLGLGTRSAQRMMQAAIRFLAPAVTSKASAPTLLGLGKAKLLELLSESDETIEALAEGGTVAGHTLDAIETMSSRELRTALAEAKEDLKAKDAVLAKKDAKLNKLAETEARRRSAALPEQEQAQLDQLRYAALAAEQALAYLVRVVDEVTGSPASEAAGVAARQALDYVAQRMQDAAGQCGLALQLDEPVDPAFMHAVKAAVTQAEADGKLRPARNAAARKGS